MSAPYAPGGARTARLHRLDDGHEERACRVGQATDLLHRLEEADDRRLGGDDAGHRARRVRQHPLERREVRRPGGGAGGHEGHLRERQVGAGEVRLEGLAVVGVDTPGDEDVLALRGPAGHQRGLGGRGGAVVVGRRDDVHAGQLGEERLVLVDRLERPLADLGLVRRVRRVELAAQEELVDDRRQVVAVDARAEEAREVGPVPPGQAPQVLHQLELGQRRRQVQAGRADARRDRLEEHVDRIDPERREHPSPLARGVRSVRHVRPPRPAPRRLPGRAARPPGPGRRGGSSASSRRRTGPS